MVDIAISWPEKLEKISPLIRNQEFIRMCKERSISLRQYSDYDWSPVGVQKDTASAKFFFNFLRRAASQVAGRMGMTQLNSLVFEEISSVALEEVASAVHDFKPGFRRGILEKSWGFEAYLQNYSLKNACGAVRKVLTSPHPTRKKKLDLVSIDGMEMSREMGNLGMLEKTHPEAFSTPPHALPTLQEEECGSMMVAAVKESVEGTPEAAVYLLHAVEGKTIRETSKMLSISRGKCHRMAERAAQRVWASLDLKLREKGIS